MVFISQAGMPNPPTLAQKVMGLPVIGGLLLSLRTNSIRKLIMKRAFLYDSNLITDSYFDNLTCFQKIRGTNEVMVKISRLKIFDTLLDEIHKLGKIDIPILIVWGAQDKSIPLERGKQIHQILKARPTKTRRPTQMQRKQQAKIDGSGNKTS
jgi:pimeloyl-ACP methyl ester carboxylesterase